MTPVDVQKWYDLYGTQIMPTLIQLIKKGKQPAELLLGPEEYAVFTTFSISAHLAKGPKGDLFYQKGQYCYNGLPINKMKLPGTAIRCLPPQNGMSSSSIPSVIGPS
jgi:hypothetical protein